ncbi:MAG: cupin domain-containing protein [Luteibaculum sp.]
MIKELVKRFELEPHPEGGFFKESYRSSQLVNTSGLANFPEEQQRNVSTGIYFLLTAANFSAFHKIRSDEMWHFYAGDPLEIIVIDPNTEILKTKLLGSPSQGLTPQLTVAANCWFASKVHQGGDYSFVGCTVAPGFDFKDFELAQREKLIAQYPQHTSIIKELTR